MEPVTNTAMPDAGPDPGLDAAVTALEGQLGDTPTEQETEPEVQPQAGPPTTVTTRQDGYRKLQTGYRERQRLKDQELRERRQLQTEYERRIEAQNALMEQQLEVLRAQRPAEEEEVPDPALDPAGFAKWQRGLIAEAMKPVLEAQQWTRQQVETVQQARQQEAQQQEHVQQRVAQFEAWEREYQEASPELAYGGRERFESMRSVVGGAFADIGSPPEMGDLFFRAMAEQAERAGENPVAYIDGWVTALAARFGMEPIGPGEEGHQPAPVAAAAPTPQQAELARLQAVRTRSAPAGNAAPRVVGRQPQAQSDLQDLFRAGVQDINQLRAAALRDSHGDMAAAANALNSLLAGAA